MWPVVDQNNVIPHATREHDDIMTSVGILGQLLALQNRKNNSQNFPTILRRVLRTSPVKWDWYQLLIINQVGKARAHPRWPGAQDLWHASSQTLHVQGAPSRNTRHWLDVSFILLFLTPKYAHATHLFPLMPPQHSEDEVQHSTAGTWRHWILFRPEGSPCSCGKEVSAPSDWTQAANTLTLPRNRSGLSARKKGKGVDKVSPYQRRASPVSGAQS